MNLSVKKEKKISAESTEKKLWQ